MTKQLLAFARAQPLEIRQIDLKAFLDDVTTLIRPSLRSNIELIIEMSDQLWNVEADAGALELALLNLAFNARDAMKDGGTLKISAHERAADGQARGTARANMSRCALRTPARACRAEVMERVFEPFFTTKSYGEGTGLGLSQVFGFTKQIGGAVTVEVRAREGIDIHALPSGEPRLRRSETKALKGDTTLAAVSWWSRMMSWSPSWPRECSTSSVSTPIVTHSAKEALERLFGRAPAEARSSPTS